MAIRNWSVTPSENNASPPNGWPEGMAPSAVNDAARKMMADIRAWYEAPEWIDYGFTVSQASSTSFTVSGADATAQFHVGRRVRLAGTSTVYGVVATSVFSSPNTTVTVTLDSGTVPADLSTASYSSVAVLAIPMPEISWGGIVGTLSNQTDLQIALNGKANSVHTHAATDVTSGAFATARLGSGTANGTTYLRGDGAWASLPAGTAPTWGAITGTLSNQTDLQGALNGKANTSHTHATADVTSGTFTAARLGSGTANGTTYLRGDGQWASLPAGTAPTWGTITGTLSSQTDLQGAINAKQNTITGAATTITGSNLTASRAVVSDGSGKVAVSAATSAEVGHLSGVTSAIQTQLNTREPALAANRKRQIFVQSGTPSGHATGDLWVW